MKQKYVQEWEVSKTYPVRSLGQLLRLFYKVHRYKEKGEWRAMRPISFLVNPAPFVMPGDPFAQDMYVAIYYGLRFAPGARYYVVVEQNFMCPTTGPHACKLYLQVHPGGTYQAARHVWIGTMQIECNFYDEEKVKAKLRRAIRLQEYFCSEESQQEIVEFDEPQPISYTL